MNMLKVRRIVEDALMEDLGMGDITTDSIVPEGKKAKARFLAKEAGIIAGLPVAEMAMGILVPDMEFIYKIQEGDGVEPYQEVAQVTGSARGILGAERVALNFLQRLSGIATLTWRMAELIRPYGVKVADTRKTTPNLRILEKYAVAVGGGMNHRYGLDDAALIKDNHIEVAGGISQAVQLLRRQISCTKKIEVETETLEQVKEALECGVDIIMLDNMSLEMMREAVALIDGRAIIEASGGITSDRIVEVAKTGIDYISMGGLTHSAPSLDISLEVLT